jgi:hypothetical protein
MDPDTVSEETKKKQIYLKTEIIETGYDVEAFCAYLESIREDGKIFISV